MGVKMIFNKKNVGEIGKILKDLDEQGYLKKSKNIDKFIP